MNRFSFFLMGAVAGAVASKLFADSAPAGSASKVTRPVLKAAVRGYRAASVKLGELRDGLAEDLEDVAAEIDAEGAEDVAAETPAS